MPEIWAVIPAAGVGARMQSQQPKQYLSLAGKTVLEHSMQPFLDSDAICGIAVAVSAGDPYWQTPDSDKPLIVASGGAERADSVLNALAAIQPLAAGDSWVLVHDAARPCFAAAELDLICQKIANAELDCDGGILALPVADTLKRGQGGSIDATVDRSNLWRALTPQFFPLAALSDALASALKNGITVTDEASAMEASGASPALIEGQPRNIKITYPQDLALAELYLAST